MYPRQPTSPSSSAPLAAHDATVKALALLDDYLSYDHRTREYMAYNVKRARDLLRYALEAKT